MECPKCGGELEFKQKSGKYWCDNCEELYKLEDLCNNGEDTDKPEDLCNNGEDTDKPEALTASLPEFISTLPSPVAIPLADYWGEDNPYIKLYRLCDAAEMITRFFAVVLLSDIKRQLGDFPDELKQTLCENLSRPTFGQWIAIVRKAGETVHKNHLTPFVESLNDFLYRTWSPLLSGNGSIEQGIIPLRNFLAHSGRIANQEAARLLEIHCPVFETAAGQLQLLTDYILIATRQGIDCPFALQGYSIDNINQPLDNFYSKLLANLPAFTEQVYLIKASGDDEPLNLFPLHSYNNILISSPAKDFVATDKHAPLLYFRYNQSQERFEFTSLAEDYSFSQAGADFAPHFFEVFDIKNWREKLKTSTKKKGSDLKIWPEPDWKYQFNDIVNELTPGLEGRDQQLEKVKEWLRDASRSDKILWISGKPGMGKSAFMAKLYQDIRRECGKARICLIPFFFRAGDSRCSTEGFYQAASYYLARTYRIEPENGSKDSHKARFERLLDRILKGKEREIYPSVIFLLDGLDELSVGYAHLLDLPLTLDLPNSRWVLSGRNEGALYGKYTAAEKTDTLWQNGELPALTSNNIREIISLELPADKYDLFQLDQEAGNGEYYNSFIEELVRKSEGLPIYIQLIIEDIKNREIGIKSQSTLPDKLVGYYDAILERLKVSDVSMQLNYILGILCWSKEPLTKQDLAGILHEHHRRTRTFNWRDSFDKALGQGNIILKLSSNSFAELGWTLYHQSLREHLRASNGTELMRNTGLMILLDWTRGWDKEDLSDSAYHYAIRYLPAHLADAYHINPESDESYEDLLELANLMTNNDYVNRKVMKFGLLYETIEDFSESLELLLSSFSTAGSKPEFKKLVIKLLEYDFSSIDQTDQRELLEEIWFESSSEIIARFCRTNSTAGQEMLNDLFCRRERNLNLTKLSLRAAEINGDYEFLIKALEYESAGGTGGIEDTNDSEADEDLAGVNRWVVDAMFLVARQDIAARRWVRFEGLIDSLVVSLEKVLMAGENQWVSALKMALQRKKITFHLKSVFEVVYKIFINYPQDREVVQRLGKIGSSLGGIIYDMPVKKLVRIPGLISLIYSMVSIKWNSVAENSSKIKSIEEIFTVSSPKQVKIIGDFINLILLANYENRDAQVVFPSLVELAFCSGLVSTSDEMYQVNRAVHGHVLYHMCKFFPDEFENQYIRKYFLNAEAGGAEGLVENFAEPISQYCPNKSWDENLEGSRGLYEMLVRFLTYEAVSTDNPRGLLELNEILIRYIIDRDLELFCQDYNIVGRPLHILTAVTIAEARVESEGLPPTVKIIKELAAGNLAQRATEAERWEAISKCYFDLFYAGIFQVDHVLNCFECLVDLKKLSQKQAEQGQISFEPTRQEIADLFMASDMDSSNQAKIEAMQKATGRFALVMLALKTVNRSKVQDYIKRNEIPEIVWQKMKRWSMFMEKSYPAPSKKVISIEQMVEKYYEQLAIGLFTNIMLIENQQVRVMMANVFSNLLQVNYKTSKQGGPKKDDLLGLLRGVMEDGFEILKGVKKV